MSKGPRLSPAIDALIKKIYIANRQVRPKEARKRLLEQMKAEGLDQIFGSNYPALNTMAQRLKKLKDEDAARSDELKRLDEPWSFGSLVEYPIPPEAIPLVASIYEKCLMEGNNSIGWNLTIREALWIGRLHKIIELYKPRHLLPDVKAALAEFLVNNRGWPTEFQGKTMFQELAEWGIFEYADKDDVVIELLVKKGGWPAELGENPTYQEIAESLGLKGKEIPLEDIVLEWAYRYSQYEIYSEIEGKPFDSNEYQLDVDMQKNVYACYGERRDDFIGQIAEDYGVNTFKLEALNLSIGDIEQVALKFSESQCRIFYVPDAEMSKMAEELRELKMGGFRGNLVFLEPNKDIPDKLLHKLEKYEVKIYKEAK